VPRSNARVTSPLKNSQLPRRRKKHKRSRLNKYALTVNITCPLDSEFLNELSGKDF